MRLIQIIFKLMLSSWATEQGGILILLGKHVTLEFGDFCCPTFATQQIKNTKKYLINQYTVIFRPRGNFSIIKVSQVTTFNSLFYLHFKLNNMNNIINRYLNRIYITTYFI